MHCLRRTKTSNFFLLAGANFGIHLFISKNLEVFCRATQWRVRTDRFRRHYWRPAVSRYIIPGKRRRNTLTKKLGIAAITLIVLTCGVIAATRPAAGPDVNGKWSGGIPSPRGDSIDVTFEFKVEGEKLTGT